MKYNLILLIVLTVILSILVGYIFYSTAVGIAIFVVECILIYILSRHQRKNA